jgi:hypothetical protein
MTTNAGLSIPSTRVWRLRSIAKEGIHFLGILFVTERARVETDRDEPQHIVPVLAEKLGYITT